MTAPTTQETRYRNALLYLGANPEDNRPTIMFSFGKQGETENAIYDKLRAEAWERGYTEFGVFAYTLIHGGDPNAR